MLSLDSAAFPKKVGENFNLTITETPAYPGRQKGGRMMDKRTQHDPAQTPRVVRTGPKTSDRRRKRPVSKAERAVRGIFATLGKIILSVILVLTITGCIVGTVLTIYVMQFVESGNTINLNDLALAYTSVMYGVDEEGNNVEIQRIYEGGENRIWVDFRNIPDTVWQAYVSVEDERFFEHEGVDFKRTLGAVYNEFKRIFLRSDDSRFGGSTITQQLIKQINGDTYNRTIDVKIKEILLAMNLERHYTKEQILEVYLNYINLGNGVNGVQAAANYYFDKDVSELTVNEAAALAAIPKNPTYLNPLYNKPASAGGTDYVKQRNERRQYCLDKMLSFNYITQAEYDKFYNTPVTVRQEDTGEIRKVQGNVYSYFVDAAYDQVLEDLQEKLHYSKDYAEQMIKTGGLRIYTTENIQMQSILEEMFEDEETFKIGPVDMENGIPDASMVIMDYDGNTLALVGGRGKKESSRTFNRATQGVQMFGSTIKPLSVYSPAMERDLINWSTMMDDAPQFKLDEYKAPIDTPEAEERTWPNNYNKKYDGPMTIIQALRESKNTIAARLCYILGTDYCHDYLVSNFGFENLGGSTLDQMALGSAGTTVLEETAAFAVFGNGGYYSQPRLYTKVLDADGRTILDNTTSTKKQVLTTQTAYIMNRALREVIIGPKGSGTAANISNYEVVGKTGTTNDRENLMFMGCTPYYVAGIRYGNDDNTPIPNSVTNTYSQIRVWKDVMERILTESGKEPAVFNLPSDGVVQRSYCLETGLLASPSCTKTATGYYKLGREPSQCSGEHEPEETVPEGDVPPPPEPVITGDPEDLSNALG